MRYTQIQGDITQENIGEAISCMPTASKYFVNVSTANMTTATTAISAREEEVTVVEKPTLEDNMWEVECSAGTFHYTI